MEDDAMPAPAQPTTRPHLIRVYYLRSHEPSLNQSAAERSNLIIIFYSAGCNIAAHSCRRPKRMHPSSLQ